MFFRRAQKVPEIQMPDNEVFCETIPHVCQHSETKLLISIPGTDLLCSHHSSMGATRVMLLREIGLLLKGDMQTSGQHTLRFVGDDVPKNGEYHIE
jgi:hypothetical protein